MKSIISKINKLYSKYLIRIENPYFEILNIALFFNVIFVFLFSFNPIIRKTPFLVFTEISSYLVCIISFILNYKKKYLYAKIFFIFPSLIILFNSAHSFGKESLIQILFMSYVGLAFIVFNRNEFIYKVLISIFALVLFFIFPIENSPIYNITPLDVEIQKTFTLINIIGFIITVVIYNIINEIINSRAQEKLDSFNHNLNSIIDTVENGLIEIDSKFSVINFNKKIEEDHDIFFKQALKSGDSLIEKIHLNYKSLFLNLINEVFLNNQTIIKTLNTEKNFIFNINFSPIKDQNNKVKSILISFQNITEFKNTETKIQNYSNNFENIFESANLIIWFFDTNGKIQNINKSAIDYYQIKFNKNEIIGKKANEILKGKLGEDLQTDIEKILLNKKSELNKIEYYDSVNCLMSDKIINYDLEGNLTGITVFSRDITAKKIAEERLRLLTSVVLNTNDSIIITEAEDTNNEGHKIIFVNDAFTKNTGYSAEEIYGKTPKILQGPKSDRSSLDKIRKSLKEWKPIQIEVINYKKNRDEFWVELNIVPIINENGIYTHWISTQRDVTERKRIEQELITAKVSAEKANRYKSQFLANMSHEIRTPLNSILGFTEELLESEKNLEKKIQLELIHNSGDSLLKLLNDILDISKIEEGKLNFSPVEFNLKELVSSVTIPHQIRAKEKNNHLFLEYGNDIPENFFEDSHRIRQILVNLISNSIKFTSKGKIKLKIELIKIENDIAKIQFKISDTGIGILAENQKLIFEIFTQEDDSITRRYGGTGLGLSICKYLVTMLNGEINIQSPSNEWGDEEVEGSDFYFQIPLKIINNSLKDINSKVVKKVLFFETKYKVLVAEDNETNQILIKKVLTKMNLDVSISKNGEEAVEMFRDSDFDIILMDIQMPILDGYKATEIIRSLKNKKQIPIIAVSANVYKDEIDNSVKVGMDGYITKPFKQIEIFEAIENAMNLKRFI